MVSVKTEAQIASMRKAGAILKDLLEVLTETAKEGMSTKELDTLARDYIKKAGAIPSFYKLNGFPAVLCTSLDDEVVHGIPSEKRILRSGMLLKIDCGVGLDGMHTDAARTIAIGKVTSEKLLLMKTARESFFEAMEVVRSGARLGDIGHAVQRAAEARGYGVVRDLSGHGIGKAVHEEPDVPNFGKAGRGERIYANMTLAIEPMLNLGTHEVYTKSDRWTVATKDGQASAHYENTVLVTQDGVEILTE